MVSFGGLISGFVFITCIMSTSNVDVFGVCFMGKKIILHGNFGFEYLSW